MSKEHDSRPPRRARRDAASQGRCAGPDARDLDASGRQARASARLQPEAAPARGGGLRLGSAPAGAARAVAAPAAAHGSVSANDAGADRLELLRDLFALAPAPMAALRAPQHVFELANEAFCRLVGSEELVGRPVREALPDLARQGLAERLDEVIGGRAGPDRPMRLRVAPDPRSPGEQRYVDFQFRPQRRADGTVSGVFLHGQDATERRVAQLRLQRVDAARNEFLAMLAHELRNPLAPLRYAIALLERQPSPSAPTRSALDVMRRQVVQLARLVGDLLEMSRVTRGAIELRCAPMRLSEALETAIDAVRPMIEQRGQTLRLQLPQGPLELEADAARIAQTLTNLLNNAAKFTPPGGHIELRAEDAPHEIVISVCDDGEGIDPALLPCVFEPFEQAHPTLDRSRGGLGLGLALVRRLVELHAGSVSAASEGVGRGACFTVRLPKRQPRPQR